MGKAKPGQMPVRRRRYQPAVSVFLLVLCAGCLPTAGARKPEWAQGSAPAKKANASELPIYQEDSAEWYFPSCTTADGSNLNSKAFAALILALKESGWIIDHMDFTNKYASARACLMNNPENCAKVRFRADLNGGIKAYPDRGSNSSRLDDDLVRWVTILERSFAIYRCYTDEALAEEMKKFGFSF